MWNPMTLFGMQDLISTRKFDLLPRDYIDPDKELRTHGAGTRDDPGHAWSPLPSL